jgi:hypothetical protein
MVAFTTFVFQRFYLFGSLNTLVFHWFPWRVECNLLTFVVWGPIGAPSWAHYAARVKPRCASCDVDELCAEVTSCAACRVSFCAEHRLWHLCPFLASAGRLALADATFAVCERHGPSWLWRSQAWAHQWPMGGPSLSPSWLWRSQAPSTRMCGDTQCVAADCNPRTL